MFRLDLCSISNTRDSFRRAAIYLYNHIMINGSKISFHRFIATTLFRMTKGWPHSSSMCGHPLAIRNSVVAMKRWTEILLPLIIIIIAPLRVERSLNLFYSSKFKKYIQPYIFYEFETFGNLMSLMKYLTFFSAFNTEPKKWTES